MPGMSSSAPVGIVTVVRGAGSLSAVRTAEIDDAVALMRARAPTPMTIADAPAIAVTRRNIRRSTDAGAFAPLGWTVGRSGGVAVAGETSAGARATASAVSADAAAQRRRRAARNHRM